jgi:hypothetical protein
MSNPDRRLVPLLVLSCAAAAALSCFEEPVTESMEIRFLPHDAAMVRVIVRLADPEEFRDNPHARDRIEQARREITEGRDAWSARLDRMAPDAERLTWDRKSGRLVRAEHEALAADADAVRAFFRDTLVQASLTRHERETEFILTPWRGSRAGRQDQERLEREMEAWSGSVARHLETGRALYGYLDANPGRAEACFASLFEDLLPEDERSAHGKPTSSDEKVLDPFRDAMEEMLGLFAIPADSAYSLEEMSRLVHDPFPAPLVVKVPGPILESEGFDVGEKGVLRVPPVSLWGAFLRLGDRWMAPDPAIVIYEHRRDGERPLDLEEFLRRARTVSPPASAADVLQALHAATRTAPIYRVRWSTVDLPEVNEEGRVWDR